MARDQSSVIPAEVTVRFQTRRCDGLVSDTVPTYYIKTVALADIGYSFAGFDGKKIIHDAATATWDVGDPDPTNQSTLDTLAEKIASDYVSWLLTAFDISSPEIIVPDPNGIIDEIEWIYERDRCQTRYMTGPYQADPEEFYHQDAVSNAGCDDSTGVTVTQTPCLVYYGPPAVCDSGTLKITRYKLCLIDGRLESTFVSTDTVS